MLQDTIRVTERVSLTFPCMTKKNNPFLLNEQYKSHKYNLWNKLNYDYFVIRE